jgi:hypothetical protein
MEAAVLVLDHASSRSLYSPLASANEGVRYGALGRRLVLGW